MSFFNDEAKDYDQWYETKLGAFVDRVETACALSLFELPKGSKVLDFGCGSGNFSVKLAEMGYEVVGIDISSEMLKLAKAKAEAKGLDITFLEMNVYDLQFEADSFDGVFSMATFEFVKEPQKAIGNLMNVLKEDGVLVIGTIHKNSAWGELYESKEVKENTVFKYAQLKTLEEMEALMPERLKASKECLFLSPNADEAEISDEGELKRKNQGNRGGFVCLKWIK